jgi:hypothetical protein
MLIFGDEVLKNEKISACRWGWSLSGTWYIQRKCFVRGRQLSILSILTLEGIIAYGIVEGSVTGGRFAQFLQKLVVCSILVL